jgi:RNA recognition motif-containing protein
MNPRGFAFVRFVSVDDAEDAIKGLDRTEIDGQEIMAAIATNTKKPERPR